MAPKNSRNWINRLEFSGSVCARIRRGGQRNNDSLELFAWPSPARESGVSLAAFRHDALVCAGYAL